MTKIGFLKPKYIIKLLTLAVIFEWYLFIFEPLVFSRFKKYTQKPLVECVTKNPTNKLHLCKSNFENKCLKTNNVIRTKELDEKGTLLKGCFKKAPDSGKACATTNECLSGFCDLEIATINKTCMITNNACGIGVNFDADGKEIPLQITTKTYTCNTNKPGICSDAPKSIVKTGESHLFEMNDNILWEKIAEEEEE